MEYTMPAFASLADPGWMEGRVGLGTTTVSEQSARDYYLTVDSR